MTLNHIRAQQPANNRKKQNRFTYIKKFIFVWNVNFYLVGNVDIFMRFVFAVLSNIEMDERFHKKDDKCD